jgi:hypothetical protein
MRQDQFEQLQQRAEQLVDVFLNESDPEKWPGKGIEPANMDKGTRGDRYWCKKDAVATLACAQRITNLLQVIRERQLPVDQPGAVGEDGEPEDSLDAEVAAAEAEAAQLLDQVQRKAAKSEFDKRVHGKK